MFLFSRLDLLLTKVILFKFRENKVIRPPVNIKKYGSGGIRTHAPEETGALNQRLRPLGHATLMFKLENFVYSRPIIFKLN